MASFNDPPERDIKRLCRKLANVDVSCYTCLHLYDNETTCEAFPDGIPADILTGQKRHDRHLRGDNYFIYESRIVFPQQLEKKPERVPFVYPEDIRMDRCIKVMENLDVCCSICVHLRENRYSCDAFPSFIPTDILTGQVRHDTPYRGDRGIRFKAKENIK